MCASNASMHLRVEYTYDPESCNWCFRVPSLHVIGGANTREVAEREAIAAVLFALEYYEEDENLPADVAEILESAETEIDHLRVTVQAPKGDGSAPKHRPAGLNADG